MFISQNTNSTPGWIYRILAAILILLLSACIHDVDKIDGRAPPIPTNVTALGLEGAVALNWDSAATNVPHNLYWSINGDPEEVIENVSSPYFHQGLINGTLYTYELTATNTAGESPRTTPITAMPVIFNWQDIWDIPVDQGNNPQCNDDKDDATDDIQCRIVSGNNTWYASRFFAGPNPNAVLDDPLTYIKLFENFDMTANGVTYTMDGTAGMNMTVESLQESSLEVRNLNIPVNSFTELFVGSFEAVLPDIFEYVYIDIKPVTFISGDQCNGINLRYILSTASNQAIPNIPPDSTMKIIVIDTFIDLFRRNILPDLVCGEDEYTIGTVKLGIDGVQSDNNWIRFGTVGIIGPPLP